MDLTKENRDALLLASASFANRANSSVLFKEEFMLFSQALADWVAEFDSNT